MAFNDPEPYAWMRSFGGGPAQAIQQAGGYIPPWMQNQYKNMGMGGSSQGGQTYNMPQWSNLMNQMTPYRQTPGMPGVGTYGLPSSVPMDQPFMQNYGWPAALQQLAASLQPQTSAATTAANIGERQKVASQMGWTTPAEASPSLMNEIIKALGSSLQTTASSAARSGMPISSVTEGSRENTIQAAIQALVRAFSGARQEQTGQLMQFMR